MQPSPLVYLCNTPETINPAIVMARQIQHLELIGGISVEQMDELSQDIEKTIQQGTQAILDYRQSLKTLKSLPSRPCAIPVGF
ncbi:MAG: hypothetical protein F6K36_22535 [Symploca sp. SIO3C6]|uniref:Uncharacterized protein n=1 Tax=Symploca sp. SIO1C4 TaxID=2607765 RepID=A0A6B3NG54_9CYAN|nr:hypothetical protein [Symploca sp. SIO3C6]NER30653.1 hypothetical protein [Symploca sp. SIO1C4]